MADTEPFTLIEETSPPPPHHLFDTTLHLSSAQTADHDLHYISTLRSTNPSTIVTGIPAFNIPLMAFAAAGHATCTLDTETDSFASWRGYRVPALRQNKGSLAETIFFAKYRYEWAGEAFVVFVVGSMQYVLKERGPGEGKLGPSGKTDELIRTVGEWLLADQEVVWVYDRYWARSRELWGQVEKANWGKVILDEHMKHELTTAANTFFSSRDVYEDLGVPWKRGLMFYGPPGNGKTISIKALMHTLLFDRADDPIPTLYVKAAPTTFDIRNVFAQARRLTPCMLVLEDVETIVTPETRSYFFNELDGLANNDGLFVVASTNYLDKLDPGLTKRPSRFDRKYKFPLPNEHERTLYCEFWRRKLANKPKIKFPKKLCPAMAHITAGFSFAFLQECFVATLLILARGDDGDVVSDEDIDDDLNEYELWRTFRRQADVLRNEIGSESAYQVDRLSLAAPARELSSADAPRDRHDAKHPLDLRILHAADEEMLPELAAFKYNVINSAAFELKPGQ